jgi:hypothetical protein
VLLIERKKGKKNRKELRVNEKNAIGTYLHEVAERLGGATGGCKHILDTSELEHLLRNTGSHNTRTSWSRNQSHRHRAALPSHLTRHGMGLSDLVPPIPSAYRDDGKFSHDDGATNGRRYLLTALHSKTNMTVAVPDNDEGFEPSPLSSTRLLLHWHDFHDLILEGRPQEELYDLVFLDRKREEVNLLKRLDFPVLHQPPQLSDGHPFLLLFTLGTTTPTSAIAASPISTAASITTAEATAETPSVSSFTSTAIRHSLQNAANAQGSDSNSARRKEKELDCGGRLHSLDPLSLSKLQTLKS